MIILLTDYMAIRIIVLLISLFSFSTNSFAQFCPDNKPDFDCKKGISVSIDELDRVVEELQNKLTTLNYDDISLEDYKTLVRITNTIGMKENQQIRERYIKLSDYISDEILMEMIFSLEAVGTKGGAMWSNKYKILIGGWPHYNSHYVIKQ